MSRCTINCELHDFLEIACLYGYRVKPTLANERKSVYARFLANALEQGLERD